MGLFMDGLPLLGFASTFANVKNVKSVGHKEASHGKTVECCGTAVRRGPDEWSCLGGRARSGQAVQAAGRAGPYRSCRWREVLRDQSG
ncbi:hypothetical protein XFF6166_820008 [Xanthomonas citri pv. fuscans]|uniref:Uncharacterized protein n=1 Tax=Xanthomonas campestris pv. phaseoli TaxID=317013 RepID=A0A7Z7NH22_XANCH|nr:hypothetical protein XFF6166_820008 [Xanthomonas citri pv. fuscans]SOO23670.1 hypothetical protein XFF6991_290077 [Xanthomonas phaseoli pv. phaseoli]SON94073.1 hypothetical protein XFF6990_140010 [Xanthomonas citri pv. fuscans]SOO01619.1 hypothetical protein XFF6960_500008 [Xanthomonas citri pv. fuscans]SOO06263.1 hypothetical protein XFF7767_690008 [Xanthomonas citri pv. fuscans]